MGNSSNDAALPAVGATSALVNLIVNLVMGLSVGAGVTAARLYGSRDEEGLSELIHTAMPTALIGGLVFGAIGCIFGGTFLKWMLTPADVLDGATLYIRIYAVGIPFSVVYSFGAAILRSVGDTTRPLIFLVTAGVVNVCFNCLFVFAFGMDVDGVATATVISQALSAALVVGYMMRTKGPCRYSLKKTRFYWPRLRSILAIGIPAGVQGSLFSISNVIIQTGINGFGKIAIAGNTSASSIEGFVYTGMNAFHETALNFTGQHVGAGKADRIGKIALLCIASVTTVGLVLGVGSYLLAAPLLSIYSPGKADVISYGVERMSVICTTYFLCGIMDVLSGLIRGMGYSFSSMFITLTCVCGLRIVWMYTYFVRFHDLLSLFLSYPLSWGVCVLFQLGLFFFAYARTKRGRLPHAAPRPAAAG